MKRKIFTLLVLMLLPVSFVTAKDEIKETGASILKDMKSAIEKASDVIDQKVKVHSAKACEGEWSFKNGNCETIIECLEDASMEIKMISGKTTTIWTGSYASSSIEIDFHVFRKETKVGFIKNTEDFDKHWIITYKNMNDEELKISSDSIPKDTNGYDFSKSTIFEKK